MLFGCNGIEKDGCFVNNVLERKKIRAVWALRGRKKQKFSVLGALIWRAVPCLGPSNVEQYPWQLPCRLDIMFQPSAFDKT